MKKIYIACCIILIGCSDILDIEPKESLSFKNIKTEQPISALVLEARKLFRLSTFKLMSRSALGILPNYGYLESPRTGIRLDYMYKTIASYNEILKFVDYIGDVNLRERLKGEAYWGKSMCYFLIIREYGDCILVKDQPIIGDVAKTSWLEIADYAIELVQNAIKLLPKFSEIDFEKDPITNKDFLTKYCYNKYVPNKGSAHALLANLCAWKACCKYLLPENLRKYDSEKLWEIVEQSCSYIINSGDYYLDKNPQDLTNYCFKGKGNEPIFILPVWLNEQGEVSDGHFSSYQDQHLWLGYKIYYGETNYARWAPYCENGMFTLELVDRLYASTDLRRDAYFGTYEESKEYPEYFKGYIGFSKFEYIPNFSSRRPWIMWRLADIYLLRAEARMHLRNNDGAIQDIDTIRLRANAPLYNKSEYGGDLQLAIFKEREKELLREGHRFYDIIRNGDKYLKQELGGDFKATTSNDYVEGCLFASIPQMMFFQNSLMKQNVYWFKRGWR